MTTNILSESATGDQRSPSPYEFKLGTVRQANYFKRATYTRRMDDDRYEYGEIIRGFGKREHLVAVGTADNYGEAETARADHSYKINFLGAA